MTLTKSEKISKFISTESIIEYNQLFGDKNSIHGKSGRYFKDTGKVVVNGAYILSIINAFIGSYFSDGVKIHSQSIQYPRLTLSESTLTLNFCIEDNDIYNKVNFSGMVDDCETCHGSLILVCR